MKPERVYAHSKVSGPQNKSLNWANSGGDTKKGIDTNFFFSKLIELSNFL